MQGGKILCKYVGAEALHNRLGRIAREREREQEQLIHEAYAGETERIEQVKSVINNFVKFSVHTMCSTTLFIQVLEGLTEVQRTSMLTRASDTNYEIINA